MSELNPEPDIEYVAQGAAKRTADAIYLHIDTRLEAVGRLIDVEKEHARDMLTAGKVEFEERVKHIRTEIDGVRREITIAADASKEAILKQEHANEKRFESVNEWRGQSLDRERSTNESMAKLSSTYVPREVADKQNEVVEKQLDALEERLRKLELEGTGLIGRRQGITASLGSIATVVFVAGALISMVVVLVNVLS